MRPASTTSLSALIGLLAATVPAAAQQQPGWVDPPAKSAASPQPAVEPDREASQNQAPAGAADVAREAQDARRSTPPRRPTVAKNRDLSGTVGATDTRTKDQQSVERARSARLLAAAYLDTVSGPSETMVGSTPRFYAGRVDFHGRGMTLSALMAEKRRFTQRWPERLYRPQGTINTTCNSSGATCVVRLLFAYRATNPIRGSSARGVSDLVLTVSFAQERPLIVSETSHVLRRGPIVSTADASRHGA